MFDTDLKAFAGFGTPSETDNSWEISAPELFGALFGGNAGVSSKWGSGIYSPTVMGVIQRNLKENGGMMVAQLIGIPIAFKYGRKLLGKNLITPANRLLAPAGVRL
ncbi:MAG: hypothetical protein ACPHX8_06890 [Candidatus Poseidoniaceae archaeon]